MNMRIALVAIFISMLFGCASTSELTDKPVKLQPDQGIAAIMLDAPRRITQIEYVAKDPGGKDFEIPDTAGGPALYLVVVRAGRYCLKHFLYWRTIFESHEDLGCVTVERGRITYAGKIVPEIDLDHATTDQKFDIAEFDKALHQQYPTLAGMYPLAAPLPPPKGVDATPPTYALSTWTRDLSGSQNQAVYFQNNTSWTIELTDFYMIECKNTKPGCGTSELNIMLAPFTRKQAMIVGPADPKRGYEYRYDYDDINAD